MRALANAVVEALSNLELSSDDLIPPDTAAGMMESIVAQLRGASEEELEEIRAAVHERFRAESAADAPEEVIDFYENFLEIFGLEEAIGDDEG